MGGLKVPGWFRGVVDLLLTGVFAVMAVSGIALYLSPSGRVARESGWSFLGVSRGTWETIHTYMGFVMIGLIAIHLLVGFRSMVTLLSVGLKKARWKPLVALLIGVGIIVGGLYVYSNVYSEDSESSGTGEDGSVVITGTMIKEYTLAQLAEQFEVSGSELLKVLEEEYHINASPNESLEEIELNNGLDRETFKEYLTKAIEELKGNG